MPTFGRWSFEVKWDGFRGIVGTCDGLRVKSRRGWNMTALLPELEALPAGLVLDGELVAFNGDGLPHFPLVCDRLLHGAATVPIVYVIFDLLCEDGEMIVHLPYRERRARLEALELRGPAWQTSERFDDGAALYTSVCELGMEGVVAKPSGGAYRPGYRGWIKVKNRSYWRYAQELELTGASAGVRRSWQSVF
jgi:bifunctional non-homologous end joining protein LigD